MREKKILMQFDCNFDKVHFLHHLQRNIPKSVAANQPQKTDKRNKVDERHGIPYLFSSSFFLVRV